MIFAMILENALIIRCCCSVQNEFPNISSVLSPQIVLIKLHFFHDSLCKVGILITVSQNRSKHLLVKQGPHFL